MHSFGHVQVSLFPPQASLQDSNATVYDIEGGCDADFQLSGPEEFLELLGGLPTGVDMCGGAHSKVLPTPASADWWVSLVIARGGIRCLCEIFKDVHDSVRAVLYDTLPNI
jgi:hypothetical protein